MAKRKSVSSIRMTEIGRCIRILHNTRREMVPRSEAVLGLGHAITILGNYKRTVRESLKVSAPVEPEG